MFSASFAESQAMDAGMSRAASRAGSISTLWSSAEVPLCLDPRVQLSSDGFEAYSLRSHSIAGSISRNSARSSQISMDFGRLSIDIPDEYPRRPDSIRLTPPRAAGSASSSGSSPSRVPSFNIGTIDEDKAMQTSSPISKFTYQPPSLGAQQRVLSSRFSEDTIDEPLLPHSESFGTFGARLSVPRKSSGISDISGTDSDRSASDTDLFTQKMQGTPTQPPTDLYRRAYRFFDKEYTVQPTLESASGARFGAEEQRFERPSLAGSELSHEDSLPSCSRSQASTQASSSDSASAWSTESSLSRSIASGPAIVTGIDYLSPNPVDTTLTPKGQRSASSDKSSDGLSIPSLPSLPSFNSSLTATRADMSREVRRRPSTADVYSQADQVSPHTFSQLPLPPPMPMISPTDPVRYEVQSYSMAPALSPASKIASSTNADANNRSTTSRLLRARVASTPKLRLDASSLFPSEQALHLQHPVPPLPGRLSGPATDRRPSTAQMDGRAPFFGRRFRSRTLGESDRSEAANMQAAVNNTSRINPSPASAQPQRSVFSTGLSATRVPSMVSHRHPSQVSATSSDLPSPMYMQPTPGSSICSASSPATTNSSLPVTPRTTTALPRPKSRGIGSASKSGGAGWASYLNSGLTLHLEGDHGRVCQINMTYLAYDPFGRPEQLVEGTEAARALTPKRPKSRGDKDSEVEQSGTLEFRPSDERSEACLFDITRSKSDGSVLLKHLTVGEDTRADLLTRQAALSLKTLGSHQVSGYERKGRLAWKLAYRVEGDGVIGARTLVPLRFSCSATLLNPERARKSRLLNLVKKQMVPTLASKAVVAGSIDSPRSATYSYEDGMGTSTASPASSRRSNKQLAPEIQQQPKSPISPIRRTNGGVLGYNSPLRQTSRTAASATSITSADSSFNSQPSQPTTPGREITCTTTTDTSARLHLQASPVAAQFGAPRPLRSLGSATAPALQLDLGPSRRLQEKASMTSLSASSISSGSVQMAKPMVINGRKLIPISLPAGLARSKRIDPALLQANVVRSPASFDTEGARGGSVSMNSSASSEQSSRRAATKKEANGMKCLLSNTPRTGVSSSRSSRLPTASESIKMEYLARTASDELQQQQQQQQVLRHQKSFAGPILTPSSFAADVGRRQRQRSKTIEHDGGKQQQRPFTADAWGESQYPSREQQIRAFSQTHRPTLGDKGASFGSYTEHNGSRREGEVGQEVGIKPLPVPPRSNARPRMAQTITAADCAGYNNKPLTAAVRHVQGVRS